MGTNPVVGCRGATAVSAPQGGQVLLTERAWELLSSREEPLPGPKLWALHCGRFELGEPPAGSGDKGGDPGGSALALDVFQARSTAVQGPRFAHRVARGQPASLQR